MHNCSLDPFPDLVIKPRTRSTPCMAENDPGRQASQVSCDVAPEVRDVFVRRPIGTANRYCAKNKNNKQFVRKKSQPSELEYVPK